MPVSYISQLTLSHFRSHQVSRLELDGRPVAIFGPNGAGKTNILEAVSLLSPGRGLRRATSEELIRRPEAVGWKIHVQLGNAEIESEAHPGQSRTVRIDGKSSPQVALGRLARMVWLVPSMDRLWIEGADGRRRFLDRIAMSFEPAHAEAVLKYEKAMRERNRLLKDMVRDDHWYVALEAQMAESAILVMENRYNAISRLTEAQAGAETVFPAAELGLTHPDGDLPSSPTEFSAALSENRSADLRAARTLMGPHRIDVTANYTAKGVPASQCSTGEQKALLISLVLANARALREDTGVSPIILLDEVAAHLDADRRAALYDEICALEAQVWMTGTGAELFAELGNRAQRFLVADQSGVSNVSELYDVQQDSSGSP